MASNNIFTLPWRRNINFSGIKTKKNITETEITWFPHDSKSMQTNQTVRLLGLQGKMALFMYLSLWLHFSCFLALCIVFLKRKGCLLNHQFQRVSFLFCQPQFIFTPPSTSLCLHPSIPPFPRELSVPICTLLVTLSTYLVPTECLCNQTNTYPVVRHSNGRLIMKLLHCELTTG